MESIFQQISDWIREQLADAVIANLRGIFQTVNDQVGQVATEVGNTPESFAPGVYQMIRNLSENVILPIAGIVLTFIACYELIQLVISHNNLANFETWIFFKWILKTFIAVTLISNTFNIVMAVFDVSQWVIQRSSGLISGSTAIDDSTLQNLESSLSAMGMGELLAILLQTLVVGIILRVAGVLIFVIVNARMVEIYLVTSLAPIPFATFGNQEQSMMGQNYLRSLFALGFQGFLIMVCVAIYAVLIQTVAFSSDIVASLWRVLGFSVLLCFTLFKAGSIAKSVLNAH